MLNDSSPIRGEPTLPDAPPSSTRFFDRARTRSSSPRHFWPAHRSRSREDPFVPINPYKFLLPDGRKRELMMDYGDQIIRQLYLLLFFRLPSIYFTRVGRVFEYAELSAPEVQKMIHLGGSSFLRDRDWNPDNVPASLNRQRCPLHFALT